MKYLKILSVILLVITCVFLSIGCSKAESPVEPVVGNPELPITIAKDHSNRTVLAVYDATINPIVKTFTVALSNERISDYHLPLSNYFPDTLKITSYGFTPNFWADIKLTHPFPGSGIDAFDPRIIAILPANPGVSFNYPIFNCVGNHKVILEPDGYTKLFDNLGGSLPGNTNPFKAYFKDQPNRIWSGTGVTEETQRWQMDINGFGGPVFFRLVVDISTNYPNPPQPVVDNTPEPVQISAFIERYLTTNGGNSLIEVTFIDWQGPSDIKCKIESPQLFNSPIQLFYSRPGPYPNEYIFSGTISNSLHAPIGNYGVLIASWDIPTDIHMFYETNAIVYDSIPGNGNLIWAKRAGGTIYEWCAAITTLSDNSTVITGSFGGYYGGATTFGPGEPNQTVLTSAGWEDMFIAGYNPDGTLAWAKHAGGLSQDAGFGITTLSDNSTVVTGIFADSAIFGPGEINQTVLTSYDYYFDIFISRYNPNGTLAWAKRAGGPDTDEGLGITTLSDNSIVVTGSFYGPATFGLGEENQTVLTSFGGPDIFIARYNPDGTLAWAKSAGGSDMEQAYAITTLSDNSTVITGIYFGMPTFGPGEPNQTVLTSGNGNIFIARYNPDGTLAWAKSAGGGGDDGYGITTLSDNSTVITGKFSFTSTFGEGEINQTVLTAKGWYDIFIARYNPDGTLAWAKRAGGSSDNQDAIFDVGNGITTLSDNSIVVTGKFQGSADFDQKSLNSAGEADIFIARYSPDGVVIWAKRAGGSDYDEGMGITTLSDNSTVVTGIFESSAAFGPGEINEKILTSAGYEDIFIARFAP